MNVKTLFLLLAALTAATTAFGQVPGQEISVLGIYDIRPSDTRKAYENGIGGALLYKTAGLSAHIPVRVGLQLDGVYFPAADDAFGPNVMVRAGVTGEIPVQRPDEGSPAVRTAAYLGYRQYLQRHTFLDTASFSSRPAFVSGVRHSFLASSGLVSGVGGELRLVFEDTMRPTFSLYAQLGKVIRE